MRSKLTIATFLLGALALYGQVVPGGTGIGGTITGQIQTATGGAIKQGTLTFSLSQPAVVSNTASVATQQVACYTSASGNIAGLPDPAVLPVVSTNTASGTLAAGTYFVSLYYTGPNGTSASSPEISVVLSAAGTINVNAPTLQPASATGFGVSIGTSSGAELFQGTVTGWSQYHQSQPLFAGGPQPAVNTSSCNIYFSDQLIPTGTYYTVNLTNKNGSQIAGFPQTWCTYGGAGGVINVSQGAPTGNCNTNGVFYPTPILSNNAGAAPQSVNTPIDLMDGGILAGTFLGTSVFGGSVSFTGTESFGGTVTFPNPVSGMLLTNPVINGITPQGYITDARTPLAGWLFSRNEAFSAQHINVVILGDSQTICYNALVSCATGPTVDINRWAEQLRIQLQSLYSSGGTGLVPLISNVGNTHVNAQYWTLTGSTVTSNILGPTQSNPQTSGSSLVQMTTGQVATFTSTSQFTGAIAFTGVNIYCATNATSGSLAVAIDSVGSGTACATPTGSATAHVVTVGSLSQANHSMTLTCTGVCYLYGAEGTMTHGVSVHNLSTASAAAEYFGSAPSTQLAFSDLIPGGTQLVILDLGTNDVNTLYGYSVTSYTNAIQAILTHEAGLSGAPSVLIVQPPVSNITGGVANWPTYTAALLGLAQSNNTAYVNVQSRWGTTFNSAYFCGDGVHPCDFGSLDEFSMISQALIDPTPTNPFFVNAQSFNATSNGNNTGNPFFNASCAPTGCDAGVSWAATGAPFYQQALWSTGNAGGISTVLGLLDQATSIFPWNTNSSDDVCFGTPISGGNIATCAGAGFHYSNSNNLTTAAFLDAGGTAAVLTGTGACGTITTQTGGAWGGSAKCTGGTGASTLTITPGINAPHGWICNVQDETTRANLLQQTAHAIGSCTLTATSVTSNDVFVFTAIAF